MNKFASISCFSLAIAVTLGALAAHMLEASLSTDSLMSFQTGVRYQVYHSLALLMIGLHMPGKRMNKAWWLMFYGMILFSLSIYGLSTRALFDLEGGLKWLGPITPIGGLMMIAAWVWFAFGFLIKGRGSSLA
jgi:uncharacterized membrane protein YgdD (TMEM256/DUF423 family)